MEDIELKATREYLFSETSFAKCDYCKAWFKILYELTPTYKTGAFDTVLLCKFCILKIPGFIFNEDLKKSLEEVDEVNYNDTKK